MSAPGRSVAAVEFWDDTRYIRHIRRGQGPPVKALAGAVLAGGVVVLAVLALATPPMPVLGGTAVAGPAVAGDVPAGPGLLSTWGPPALGWHPSPVAATHSAPGWHPLMVGSRPGSTAAGTQGAGLAIAPVPAPALGFRAVPVPAPSTSPPASVAPSPSAVPAPSVSAPHGRARGKKLHKP